MANSDDRYEMLRDRELRKLSWVVKKRILFFNGCRAGLLRKSRAALGSERVRAALGSDGVRGPPG